MIEIGSAEQIEIIEISIRSERFLADKRLYVAGEKNEAPVGVTLEIFEDIWMPYLTGNLVVHDDNNIYGLVEISGTERVHVRFKSPAADSEIEKIFIVSSLDRAVKVNDNVTHLLLELIEDHGYFDGLSVINKSYNGTGDVIIQKILEDNTNKQIRVDTFKSPSQKDMRYIVPWQTPYTAINTIVNFITTDNSMPYFFYSSLVSKELILTDLESILEKEAFNKARPFLYSRSGITQDDPLNQVFGIASYDAKFMHETFHLARRGAIGSSYESVDTLSGVNIPGRIDMKEQYKELNNADIINLNVDKFPIDDRFRVDGEESKSITEYNSKKYATMSAVPYDDINSLTPDYLTTRQIAVKNNFLKHLVDNSFTVVVPGLVFAVNNLDRAVGSQIKINIVKEHISETDSIENDERRSGTFVMLAKKHVFNILDSTHNVVLKVGRITEPRRIS